MTWHFGRVLLCLALLALIVVDARRLFDSVEADEATKKDVTKAEEAAEKAQKAAKKAQKAAEKAEDAQEEAEEEEEDDDDGDDDDDDDDDDDEATKKEVTKAEEAAQEANKASKKAQEAAKKAEDAEEEGEMEEDWSSDEDDDDDDDDDDMGTEDSAEMTESAEALKSGSGTTSSANSGTENPLNDLKNEDSAALLGSQSLKESDINRWANHCYDGKNWKDYPCKLGWRHGCREGACWSQCHGGWMLKGAAEWCWVGEGKPKKEAGTADDSDFTYIACKTDADCTEKQVYKKKCYGMCSMGARYLRR